MSVDRENEYVPQEAIIKDPEKLRANIEILKSKKDEIRKTIDLIKAGDNPDEEMIELLEATIVSIDEIAECV